jgi:hypothetical protein
MGATHPSTIEFPVDDFSVALAGQTDHETNHRIESLPSPSHNLELLWSDNESDDEHDGPVKPLTEYDSPVPLDHITEGEAISHEISTDSSFEIDDAL